MYGSCTAEETDEALIESTLYGDNDAFNQLVLRYQRTVFSAAYSVLRNVHLAEDIAQDAFLAAWQKLNTLKEPDKFGSWVYHVASNKAKDYLKKHRESISLEHMEHTVADNAYNPESLFFPGTYDSLHEAVENLSEKLRIAIKLHYFEASSIEEIARQLKISAGTVKWRLHEGREKIRKGMMQMSKQAKKITAELLGEMAQIRERYNRSNEGFESDYKAILAKINDMPETPEVHYCLAEWLEQGYIRLPLWKKPGIDEIAETAEKGNHTALLGRMWEKECEKLYGSQLRDYFKDKLIPRMEEAGMTESLGRMWIRVGDGHRWDNEYDKSYEAFQKALELLPPHSTDRAEAAAVMGMWELFKEHGYSWTKTRTINIGIPLIVRDGRLIVKNGTQSASDEEANPFIHAALCDSILFDNRLKIGESIISHDGTVTLTYDSQTADGCALWITKGLNVDVSAYYKSGIGLVAINVLAKGYKMHLKLKSHTIVGGEGLMPLHEGNVWEYDDGRNPEHFALHNRYEIISTSENEAIVSAAYFRQRLSYDQNSWDDNILEMRYGYNNENKLIDVSESMNRAAKLAATPYQKLHTQVANEVMERIFKGDTNYTPDGDFSGHWNFFSTFKPYIQNDKILCSGGWGAYSFEWKNLDSSDAAYPLLGTFMLDMFKSAVGCFWCYDWKPGVKMTMEGNVHNNKTVTEVIVEDAGMIETAAGRFGNCLKVFLDVKQNGRYTSDYFTGEKEYYFAPGIGIVRSVHHFKQGKINTVYDLTAYTGAGSGYMPIEAGLFRRYEAQNLTGGYVGKVELTFCDDDNRARKILENKTGIRSPRKSFSELDWDDNIIQLAQEYCDGNSLKDVSATMKRVEALANTPYRKLYADAAIDYMNRIFEGDAGYTNNGRFSGHWDFFQPRDITIENGKIQLSEYDGTYAFEWKSVNSDIDGCYSLLGNNLLDFLMYGTGSIWRDEWKPGVTMTMEGNDYWQITAQITVTKAGTVETAAGRFENCIMLSLDAKGANVSGFVEYLVGKKDYCFAPKIGIVKLVNHFKDGKLQTIYELTGYEGTGEGYMPVNPGLFRRYEAIGLTGGYAGKTEYTFCEDDSGQLKVIENRTGIRIFDSALAE
ncbi:MAG: sigma-70 family RNA polymerase sigma factor [Oscillospiraceae bacterium]|nr:sigma-70 family RNA polymerase sigma factor [Oscillospiraceae bacterium]